jgi:hypothetical protein
VKTCHQNKSIAAGSHPDWGHLTVREDALGDLPDLLRVQRLCTLHGEEDGRNLEDLLL